MNQPMRRLSLVIIVMFATLFAALSYIQFFAADSLNSDARNVRTLYREYGVNRGPIIVAGDAIVTSVPTDGTYKYQRTYLNGPVYATVTGYFSVVYNAMTGLERSMNKILGGTDSSLAVHQIGESLTGESRQGGAIALTLDAAAQQAAYEALSGRKGAVAAIEPSTGKILALVSSPSFDPNEIANHDVQTARNAWDALNANTDKPTLNRAAGGDLYPPGSIFKVITAAAMLESGITPETEIEAPTKWAPPGTSFEIGNSNGVCGDGSGKTTLRTAFTESCNTPFAIAGTNLGAETMIAKAEAFGFHEEFKIPMRVAPSLFPQPADTPALAMDSFGQKDIQVSPLQMAMVAAAVANDGVVMTPYLVDQTLTADLEVISQTKPKAFNRAMSSEVASQLRAMMIDVMKTPTLSRLAVPGVELAGKTGTAQLSEGDPHSWLIAFDASSEPKIAVAVFVENGGLGSGAAGEITQKVISAVVNK
ncbi:MAG: penicillin-binding transpeptidase domain-containing protein [Arcanobacterium sp.]|nr:penicillin-binding transpeptidase domain-containing protein [Arcanobacterium sp.]